MPCGHTSKISMNLRSHVLIILPNWVTQSSTPFSRPISPSRKKLKKAGKSRRNSIGGQWSGTVNDPQVTGRFRPWQESIWLWRLKWFRPQTRRTNERHLRSKAKKEWVRKPLFLTVKSNRGWKGDWWKERNAIFPIVASVHLDWISVRIPTDFQSWISRGKFEKSIWVVSHFLTLRKVAKVNPLEGLDHLVHTYMSYILNLEIRLLLNI